MPPGQNGLPEPLPGFDDPVGLLRACHDRILQHCELLERLPETPDSATARQVVRYFTTSAVQHHRDEEEDLFPLINRQSMKIAELVFQLRKQHVQLDELWNALLPQLRSVPQEGFDADFRARTAEFCTLYREHIQRENRELLPLISSSLSRQQLGMVGEKMAARRGVRFSAL
jgi:hemerythrin-like domain-containing protein